MYLVVQKQTFINDTFINNRAAGDGGAVYAYTK